MPYLIYVYVASIQGFFSGCACLLASHIVTWFHNATSLSLTSHHRRDMQGKGASLSPSHRAWFLLNIWGVFLGWEELHNFGHSRYLRFHPGSLWIPALGFCWHMVINQFHPVWDWFRSKLEFLFDMFARYFNTIIKLFVIIGVLKQYLYDEQQMFTKQQINKPWIRER